jgi:erythromycin esterase-like protein
MIWRQIGSVANNGWGVTGTLTSDFDAVIFFDQTTPSILLR